MNDTQMEQEQKEERRIWWYLLWPLAFPVTLLFMLGGLLFLLDQMITGRDLLSAEGTTDGNVETEEG